MSTLVLTGGVGGAKLVLGLTHVLPPEDITVIVNTGDDFQHLGLAISPDIDTLLYTLSGRSNAAQGWGREGETWSFMEALRSLDAEDWFLLGDGDLALHILRTHWLSAGESLSCVTERFATSWGLKSKILPMSDDKVATHVATNAGDLSFQRYFVEQRCAPPIQSVRFAGAQQARPAPGVIEAICSPKTSSILIAPSNPWLSIDPILSVPDIVDALRRAKAPVVAISPIVGGQSVKGPTSKIMTELGIEISNSSIARHYNDVIDAILIDERDPADDLEVPFCATDILMTTLDDRIRVASEALKLARSIAV
ncbi:2-phospho-L-lactate transferase [Sphingobium sp. CR2-8]|uniref:2-phospho-L-lactate transferase n=1 Tax=Sphingobium sp. CR2-8 TaxID=1306534 RepID=UPI002DBC6A90|nr:2-phospho-L-lactate transferase [Sphingobium sp. CR2-8]MEC3909542.1 2-phospho-L-lactate transferase [Sphingobium sp. CR2-8]